MSVCVCVCIFQSFPFFLFFGLGPSVFPLRRQFIYVHYFRLPDFYSPLGVSPETHEFRSTMRFGRVCHYYTALRLLRCPPSILYSPHNIHITHTLSSVCRRQYIYIGILNCFHSNTGPHHRLDVYTCDVSKRKTSYILFLQYR